MTNGITYECSEGPRRPAQHAACPGGAHAYDGSTGCHPWTACQCSCHASRLDTRDAVIRSERQVAFDKRHGPRVGDLVVFPDGHHERISHDWGDEVQTSHQQDGRWHLGEAGFMSFSGGLNPPVPKAALKVEAGINAYVPVWFFHHGHWRAHNDVETTARVRIYRLVQEEETR